MSHKRSKQRASFSPTQRKACLVLVGCVAAVIVTFVASWILPGILLGTSSTDGYDPDAYPVDTSLGAVLTETSDAGNEYIASTVFAGDENTVALTASSSITIDRYVGQAGLSVSDLIRESCVYFEDDPNSYTIPQAIAKMKPRRVVVTLGGVDAADGITLESFIQDYRQALNAIKTAYGYCDIIVNAIAPVNAASDGAAQRQTCIDQYNQQLAQLCESDGYKYLNSAETLKNADGFAQDTYVSTDGTLTNSGVNALLHYVSTHAYETEDRRPDTNDIPRRADQPAQQAAATPSPTPLLHTVSYGVQSGSGTLTYNDQKNVSTLRFEVPDGETVRVTAEPDEGYILVGWSDGLKDATRVERITKDVSASAIFARIELRLDKGNTTMTLGDTLTINADVTVDGQTDDNSGVQWSVNGQQVATAGSYDFKPDAAGAYTITAVSDFDGAHNEVSIQVNVEQPATSVTLTVPRSMQAGTTATLTVVVENGSGDTNWSCAQMPDWSATGDSATFTPSQPGRYYISVTNNGITAEQYIEVTAAPTPAPTPTPSPTPEPALPFPPFDNDGDD